ncbi:hypothetical protein IEQ34_006090 [Dendrobium chrysotoxum]|uniref:Bulb-type lectin domain-containing protein n=1 Tax=Dendrobium chrysotoxum TaxID=161865 RepID=A0AAV7HAR6_DENCH|nr:hypothetical protein IEQ34_006090 [Dendrobium chrysotoxum]
MAFFSMIKVLLLCTTSLSLLVTLALGQNSTNYLLSGERLNTNQYLIEGNTKFIIQNDCDLVLYKSQVLVWHSNTTNEGSGCYLIFQPNGKLVIFDNKNEVVWDTTSIREIGNYILTLNRGHNVVIYGPKVWDNENNTIGSDDVVVATSLNGPMGALGLKNNKMMEMGKIIEFMSNE